VYTNDQQTSKAFVQGEFPIKWKWVSESTADFLAAMEPQPLWNGSLPVCLVEYHQGLSRRLRLVLTWQSYLTKGEKELLDHQHPVHGRIHSSGLLFGYAADRCTEPDWYVLPDGHLPDAWKLIHAARKGGDRFCVGREARYTFRQDDAANKAKDYSFESLFFFPRVRTPCGHGAQVIVEGRKKRQMVEKGTKTPKNNPKTKHPSPQADSTIL